MDNMKELRKEVMNNIEELTEDLMNGTLPKVEGVISMYAIGIGTLVAAFLLNTGRGLKIIQLCKECLILLHNEEAKKEKQFFKLPFKIASYHLIFRAYCLIPDYTNAVKYGKRLLVIYRELGETPRERSLTMELANIYVRQYKYVEARELYKTAISIMRGTSNRKGETITYGELGHISFRLGEYTQAIEYHEKALAGSVEIGDREREAVAFSNLGSVFQSLSKCAQAKEYLEKALTISVDIGNRKGEAKVLGNLGGVFKSLGQYAKAIEYQKKALAISMEIGDREEEASGYEKLGIVFMPLGELAKAKEYFEKALAIRKEIGGREGEASSYENQATVFETLGKYLQAKEYHEKALAIKMEIGDRAGVASSYVHLGTVLRPLGEYIQAKEYFEKALVIFTDIGHREGEASVYTELGGVFDFLGDQVMAEGYLEKALSIYEDIKAAYLECYVCFTMAVVKLYLYKFEEAYYYLSRSISKSEDLRGFLEDNDQLKISFSDFQVLPYKALSRQLISFSNDPNAALCVLDLGRARALADLMAAQYSVEKQIYAAPQSWIGIENIMKKESNCTCLYISYHLRNVLLWIIRTSGVIHFQKETVCGSNTRAELVTDELDEFFTKSFRRFEILPEESCEDRSLNDIKSKTDSPREESLSELRLVEEDDEGYQNPETLFYKMLIAPVADLLVEPEIIIVPERNLYQIPFSALRDEDGKYLSETFRIRIVPSLTTLKLIKDSPADYHSQTGALIVGDPVVGWVLYKGSAENLKPLPCARKEAEMIGRLLGIQPLLGEHATKQAVLELIHSVSLIHFAAHGNAERGEIVLSPLRATDRIPEEEEYLLTMSDISQVQLRAKLVVLSCCHSGSGQIRAEGVVGIARAFLGSGARSVLVALWALEDSATEQLMRCFYEHLVGGESASECLHEAMKWMRCNGYSDVRQWAPFMLIGDNVTFDIAKIKEEDR